jgi:hypothetical protein
LLCFLGVGSLHLSVLGSGFALGWLIAGLCNANTATTVLVGLGCAVVAWVLVSLVFRFGAFFVGSVAGGVIGARVFQCWSPAPTRPCSPQCSLSPSPA